MQVARLTVSSTKAKSDYHYYVHLIQIHIKQIQI